MDRQVNETVYTVFGITPILDALDEEVIQPIIHHRYGIGPLSTPAPPKLILLTGTQGCGQTALCSALVNELRRGQSSKRGNVHYKNREVTYLEWNYRNPDAAHLSQIFAEAKVRDFTVLTMPNFDRVCPSQFENGLNRADPRVPPSMKGALTNELDGIPAGKILVVAITARETFCDQEMLDRMEYKYHLPLPDADARRQIIMGLLEEENAELKPPNLIDRLVYSTRLDYTVGDLVYVVNGALRQARARQREQLQNGNIQRGFLAVTSADWSRYLDLVLEERMMEAMRNEEEEEEPEEQEEFLMGPANNARAQDVAVGPHLPQQDEDVQILRVFPLEPHHNIPPAPQEAGIPIQVVNAPAAVVVNGRERQFNRVEEEARAEVLSITDSSNSEGEDDGFDDDAGNDDFDDGDINNDFDDGDVNDDFEDEWDVADNEREPELGSDDEDDW